MKKLWEVSEQLTSVRYNLNLGCKETFRDERKKAKNLIIIGF
jgi:hypothetical protein